MNTDLVFLAEAFQAARLMSHDPNTQTGAVIVDPNEMVISRGANRLDWGLIQKYGNNYSKELVERPLKYKNVHHAEVDAIYVANRNGISLKGCTLYSTWSPCDDCAEVIVNNGIKRVVTHQCTTDWYNGINKDLESRKNWDKSIEKAIQRLERNGVLYRKLDAPLGGIKIIFDDKLRII